MTNQLFNETDLVNRVRSGDNRAQYQLYNQYVDAMYHSAIRIVHNRDDAQDVVQETFIKVFQKIGSFRSESTLGAWIKRIAVNTAINHMRRSGHLTLVGNSDDVFQHQEVNQSDTGMQYSAEEIHRAVKHLPFGCGMVLNLYAFEGYSHKEISEILSISESTSKTQYRRAKELLKSALNHKTVGNDA